MLPAEIDFPCTDRCQGTAAPNRTLVNCVNRTAKMTAPRAEARNVTGSHEVPPSERRKGRDLTPPRPFASRVWRICPVSIAKAGDSYGASLFLVQHDCRTETADEISATRLSGKYGSAYGISFTGGVPCVWNVSIVFSPHACPFFRSVSVQVTVSQSGARISRAPAFASSTRLPAGSQT